MRLKLDGNTWDYDTYKVVKGLRNGIARGCLGMITIKQYADKWNISTQAVYAQLKTHQEELEGHIHKKDGSNARWLDEEAVAVLEKIRETNPTVIERDNSQEKIEELENNIKVLLTENATIANKLSEALEWKAEKAVEIAQSEMNQKLLTIREEQYEDEKKRADELEEENKKLREELQNKQKKSWLQKLLGK